MPISRLVLLYQADIIELVMIYITEMEKYQLNRRLGNLT